MEESNGVYKIPCIVNGARMKFIFDTGATSVSMSKQMANYLLENEYILKEDVISSGQSSIADGTIVDHVVINLRDIEISGLHLHNVKAVVLDSQNAPLLLGQSAIQKLGRFEINGNILKILDEGKLDENQIKQTLQMITGDMLKIHQDRKTDSSQNNQYGNGYIEQIMVLHDQRITEILR